MSTWILIGLPLLAAWALLSLFYQGIIRPVIGDVLRFGLFAIRDKLRMAAINGEVDQSSFSYQHLERVICRLVDASPWVSIGSMIELQLLHGTPKPTADMLRFEQEAPKELREMRQEAFHHALGILFVNSPFWSVVGILAALIATLSGKAGKKWVELKTAVFVERELESDSLQPA